MAILLLGMVSVGASAATSQLAFTPPNLRFGAIVVGHTETLLVTVTNTGQASATVSGITVGNSEFTTSSLSLPVVLSAGQSVDLSVSFAPTTTGWTGGTIKFFSNVATANLNVGGTGESAEPVAASPSIVSFGQVALGSKSTVPVVLTNARSWNVTLSALQTSGSGFSVNGPSLPVTLGVGQSVRLNVVFAPQSTGTAGGSLFVSGPALAIPLTGTGIAAAASSSAGHLTSNPASLAFGSTQVGSSMTLANSLTNTGVSSVTISQATATGAGFSIGGLSVPFVLSPGASVPFSAVFTPQSAGSASGGITVVSNASNSTLTVLLTGTGTAPAQAPAPLITSATTASGTVGTAFSYQVTATNTPTSYGATGLPAGLSVNSGNGLISGTPATAATSTVTLSASNSGGIGNATLTLTIKPAVPVITSATTASGTVGSAFSYQITASNTPTSYGATGLPAGLSVNSTSGLISGTLTTAATSTVTLSASNSGGTGSASLTLTIAAAPIPAPVITSATTASGTVGSAFSYQITASNTPTSYGATGLPAGLSVNSTSGLISGTLTTAATSTVTLSASNSGGTGSASLTLTIAAAPIPAPVITSATTASGTVGSAFSYQITASNTPTSYGATGLPAGLSVNSTSGLISGTPTAAGTSTVTLSATNSGGTGNATLTLTIVAAGQLTSNPASLAFGSAQVGSSLTLTDSLTNTGGSSVTISQATATGTGFSISGLTVPLTLTPGASVTFSAVFAPQSAVSASGGITVASNASNSTLTVSLTGTGTAAGQLTIAPTALSFGNATVGTSVSQSSSLSAAGASVTVSSASLSSAEFSLTGISLPVTLAAGQSVPVTMTFTPQSSGSASGVLTVGSNGSNTATQTLSGVGVAATQHSVSLSWTDTNSGIAGYNIYRGNASAGPFTEINSGLDATPAYSDTSVVAGQTYYYVATAVNESGAESAYSNEVEAVVPSP